MDEDTVEEETSETPEADVSEEEQEETPDELKARLAKAEELANNYKARAEKAEKKAKEAKPADGLSPIDLIAISKANIEAEDLEEVLDYAAYKKIGIAEALQSSILKATLAEKAEQRKSALAVNTGGGRRADTSVSDDRLMADAAAGKMPESTDDIARLAILRMKQR